MNGNREGNPDTRQEPEKYIFRYDQPSRKVLLGVFGRLAANSDIPNFSWHDAAVLIATGQLLTGPACL